MVRKRQRGQVARSMALPSPSRRAGMVSGSRGGSERGASRPTSLAPRAWQCHGSTAAPRPTESTPRFLKRGFLGWLRGEIGHCKMVAIPSLAEEDARRPTASVRARWRANSHCQPHEGSPDPAWHPKLNPEAREGGGARFDACASPRASGSRPTRWTSYTATCSANGSSKTEFGRSRMLARASQADAQRWTTRHGPALGARYRH